MESTPAPFPGGEGGPPDAARGERPLDPAEIARREAAGTPARVRLPRNLALLASAEAGGRFLAFVATIVVARVLGPEGFGPLGVALALVLYLGALGDAGLTLWTRRQIVLRPHDLSRLVAGTLLVQLCLSALIVAVIALVAFAVPFEDRTGTLLLVLSPYAVMQALNLVYALQALERMGAAAAAKALAQLVAAALAIVLVAITADPVPVAISFWVGLLVGDLVAWRVLRRRYGVHLSEMRTLTRGEVSDLVRAGLPFLAIIALLFFVVSIDIVMVGALKGGEETGEYAAARRLVATPLQIIQVLLVAVFPEMVRRFAEDRAGFAALVHTTVRLALRPTLAATVFVIAEAGPIAKLVLGSDFSGSADPLAISVLLVPLFWFFGLVGYALLAAGRQRAFLLILAVTAAASAAAYPLLIVEFGSIGAACVATGTVTVQALAFSAYGRRHFGLRAVTEAMWELPYATVPLAALILLHVAIAGPPLGLAFVVWAAATLLVEFVNGMPTLRGARGLAGPILARGGAAA